MSFLRCGCLGGKNVYGGASKCTINPKWCMKDIAIQHEFFHVLGLRHEHFRSDRDNYVKILTENVREGIIIKIL